MNVIVYQQAELKEEAHSHILQTILSPRLSQEVNMTQFKAPKRLWLGEIERSQHHLKLNYGMDQLAFSTSYWYEHVDLLALEQRYGTAILDKIYFHILAFEANKLISLGPESIDPGPHANYWTPEFESFWQGIAHKVWAQWRYQHNRPDYKIPGAPATTHTQAEAIDIQAGSTEVLAFCGGGKDSLVSLKILEEAQIAYDSYGYAHSVYGTMAFQHQLIESLVDHAKPTKHVHHWISDDFMDSPVMQLYPEYEVEHTLAAETPSSLFGVLPVALSLGYTQIVLAHERSADRGNLIWDKTGEDVNHQWGKSLEAEMLLNGYIQKHLLKNFHYFSLLKPLYDVVIFNFLTPYPEAVKATHSCNIKKPWCARCPKCAYVWVNYMAYLDVELVNGIFDHENLFDLPENQLAFRQMLGLEDHTPFECIGQIQEVQLAFALCHVKGLTGQAMDVYLQEVGPVDWQAVLQKYTEVNLELTQLPGTLAEKVVPLMQNKAQQVRSDIQKHLQLA